MVAPDTGPYAVAHMAHCSRDQPVPLKLVCNPSQFSVDSPDLLNVSLGPSSMLCVRRRDPRLAFECPWSGRPAAMQLAPGPTSNGGVLARLAGPGPCTAPAPLPIWPETSFDARFDKGCVVS